MKFIYSVLAFSICASSAFATNSKTISRADSIEKFIDSDEAMRNTLTSFALSRGKVPEISSLVLENIEIQNFICSYDWKATYLINGESVVRGGTSSTIQLGAAPFSGLKAVKSRAPLS